MKKYQKELFELLSIPTISAQSGYKSDMEKACVWLKKKLETLEFKAKILPTQGHSVVYAENLKAGRDAPIVLVYGHYDVQSADPLEEWTSEPFKPEVRSGNIYARGATDNKGQFFTWIAAIEEVLKNKKGLPVNIKFLLEGEEEIGSKNLEEFVKENKSLLEADVCVISDTHSLSEKEPVITYGLRGLLYYQVKIKTMAKDAHSGIYGGNILNPANVLSQIIAKLKNDKHKVLVPGFYTNVRKLSQAEVSKLNKFPFREKEIKEEAGTSVVVGESGYSTQVRGGARPTLDVNGLWSGYQGEGPKTIIPSEAGAKISMRLVPNQKPKDIEERFEKYFKSLVPKGVEYELELLSSDEPILMNTKSEFFKLMENSSKKVFGKEPIYELSGGSIPVVAILKNTLGIDSVLIGYGLPDDGLHSPNEKISIAMFEKGIKNNVEFLKSL